MNTEEKHTHTVSVRFSRSELAEVDRLRQGLPRGTWCRYVVLGKMRDIVYVPEVNRDAYMALGKLGGLMNQLMRHLNAAPADEAQKLLIENAEAIYVLLGEIRMNLLGLGLQEKRGKRKKGNEGKNK
jgi:hypothetical protein